MARISRKKTGTQSLAVPARIWRTALYARLSVEDNGKDADSIENQLRLLEDYVSRQPELEQTAVFVDNGFTGTNTARPEYIRMMDAIRSGRIDCIVVKDLSRLGRNYIETSEFIEKICPFFGIRFVAVNNGLDTEQMTSQAQLHAALTNVVNDFYARDISRKVSTALRAKMERGEYIGNYAPYGYRKDPADKNHLIPDPATAPVIQRIYALRAAGQSYMGICKILNAENIASPGQYRLENGIVTNNNVKQHKLLWNKHIVTEILKNPVYIGHLVQRKGSQSLYKGVAYHLTEEQERITVYNTHTPLIAPEIFEQVQAMNRAAAAKQKANAGKYAALPKAENFYKKKFVCAHCGAVMKLHRSFNTKHDKVYFMFKCPTYAEHGSAACMDVKIRKAELDQAVLAMVNKQMEAFLDMEKTVRQVLQRKKAQQPDTKARKEMQALRSKIASKQTVLSEMYLDLKEGLLTEQEYLQNKRLLLEDISVLQDRLDKLTQTHEQSQAQRLKEQKWKAFAQKYARMDEICAEIVETFLAAVAIHVDGTLDIQLNYADELAELAQVYARIREEAVG